MLAKGGGEKWKKGGPGRALLDRRCFTTRQKETGGGQRNGIRQIIERKSTLHQDFVFTKLNFLFEFYLTFLQLVAEKWDQSGDSAQDRKERRDILFLIRRSLTVSKQQSTKMQGMSSMKQQQQSSSAASAFDNKEDGENAFLAR